MCQWAWVHRAQGGQRFLVTATATATTDQFPFVADDIVTIVPTRVKQLLVPHILNGELAIELPSIAEKKAYIAKQLTEETWESELRIEMPHKHYVNMTPAVAECRSKMYAELHGGKV